MRAKQVPGGVKFPVKNTIVPSKGNPPAKMLLLISVSNPRVSLPTRPIKVKIPLFVVATILRDFIEGGEGGGPLFTVHCIPLSMAIEPALIKLMDSSFNSPTRYPDTTALSKNLMSGVSEPRVG